MAKRSSRKRIFEHVTPSLTDKLPPHRRKHGARLIIKISGEMLGGDGLFSIPTFRRLAHELKLLSRSGFKIGLVVGGGNICRGRDLEGIDRIQADWMGMTATLINGLMLTYFLEKEKVKTRLYSGVAVDGLVERFALAQARALYDEGWVLVFVFGTGNPAFTTDTATALRAVELGADTIIKGTKVDGVFDRDPMKDMKAKFYSHLSYNEAIRKRLGVMDTAAFSLCAEHKITIHVFNFDKYPLSKAIVNPRIGTIVS